MSQSTLPKKIATGAFTHNSKRTKSLKTLIETQRKVKKSSNLAYAMLLVQERIWAKKHDFLCAYLLCFARNVLW